MSPENSVKIFQEQGIRSHWDNEQEQWYFSVIDVVAVLADNARARKYWNDLKRKLSDEVSELSENIGQMKIWVKNKDGFEPSTACRQLKTEASDGKNCLTNIADSEPLFRLIFSMQKVH